MSRQLTEPINCRQSNGITDQLQSHLFHGAVLTTSSATVCSLTFLRASTSLHQLGVPLSLTLSLCFSHSDSISLVHLLTIPRCSSSITCSVERRRPSSRPSSFQSTSWWRDRRRSGRLEESEEGGGDTVSAHVWSSTTPCVHTKCFWRYWWLSVGVRRWATNSSALTSNLLHMVRIRRVWGERR